MSLSKLMGDSKRKSEELYVVQSFGFIVISIKNVKTLPKNPKITVPLQQILEQDR